MLARHAGELCERGSISRPYTGRITKADFKTAAASQRLGDEGDDAWRNERSADPLHCPRIDAKPSSDLAHTGPSRSRQGLTDSFFLGRGLSEGGQAVSARPESRKGRHGLSRSRQVV
jgi:hypothetical protein